MSSRLNPMRAIYDVKTHITMHVVLRRDLAENLKRSFQNLEKIVGYEQITVGFLSIAAPKRLIAFCKKKHFVKHKSI